MSLRSHVSSLLTRQQKDALRHQLPRLQRLQATPFRRDLDRLARIYGSDKASTDHDYVKLYLRHLPERSTTRSVLEIGIGGVSSQHGYETRFGGASLRMWQDYFPAATVVGLDIHPKTVRGARIKVVHGSQDDPELLRWLGETYGPFDVIIDDGSHIGRHQSTSLHGLWEHLRPGGVYVIEDLGTSYREDHEGGAPGLAGTGADIVKGLIDEVLSCHHGRPARDVNSLHLYDEIVFLTRT